MGNQNFLKTFLIHILWELVNITVTVDTYMVFDTLSTECAVIHHSLLSITTSCHYNNSLSSSWLNQLLLEAQRGKKISFAPEKLRRNKRCEEKWWSMPWWLAEGSAGMWHDSPKTVPCSLVFQSLAYISSFLFPFYEYCTKMCIWNFTNHNL